MFGEIDELVILYSTDGGASFTPLTAILGGPSGPLNTGGSLVNPFLPTSAEWASKAFNLPAGTNKLMFRGVSGFGNNLYLDNIRVEEIPPCLPPTAPLTIAVGPTSHSFSWTASPSNPSSGYQWEVRSSGAAGSGATGLVASGSTAAGVVTATATGLTGGTSYSFYVRSNCGAGVFSSWTMPKTFTTACVATNLPYSQNFDSAIEPNFPACVLTQDLNGGGDWGMWYDGDIVAATQPNSIYYRWNAATPANDWFFLQGLNLVAGKTVHQ